MHHDAVWPQRDWFWISSAIKQTLFRMRPCEGKWPWLSALNFSRDVHIISSPVVANIIMGHVPHKILPGYCHALPSLWRSSPGSADPWSSRYPWDDTAQSEFRRQEDPPRRTKLGKLCQMMLIHMCEKYLKHPQMRSKSKRIMYIATLNASARVVRARVTGSLNFALASLNIWILLIQKKCIQIPSTSPCAQSHSSATVQSLWQWILACLPNTCMYHS